MAYTKEHAINTAYNYLGISADRHEVKIIPETAERGIIFDLDGEKIVIFIYPISCKKENKQNWFDTRDSGVRERQTTWNYAQSHNLKYFCLGFNDNELTPRYKDFALSLESNEKDISNISYRKIENQEGTGTQVNIPNDVIPNQFPESEFFKRVYTDKHFYISIIHKNHLRTYLKMFDNRPYMEDDKDDTDYTVEQNTITEPETIPFPHNRIMFGAPGTGKSHQLDLDRIDYFKTPDSYERVTFHSAYSYAQFFGTYKPVSENVDKIAYRFVPGPFLRMLLKAIANPSQNYLLVIEEINRADVASVFGDVFQLLDRTNGRSDYKIDIPEDLLRYINNDELHQNSSDLLNWENLRANLTDNKLYLPSNLYIWATMNSADQGVMPLDTAFKRRWVFEYIDIDHEKDKANFYTPAPQNGKPSFIWSDIRNIINNRLKAIKDISEDKMLGPFFLKEEDFTSEETFKKRFKSKVLMYLFQDVVKFTRPGDLFVNDYTTYMDLCNDFDLKGIEIFVNANDEES